MRKPFITSSLIAATLFLSSACGPETPGGTTPPSDAAATDAAPTDEAAPAADGADTPPADGADGAAAAAADPTQKVCDAEVGDINALFADAVLIRFPKGMSADNLREINPFFLQLGGSVESVGCLGEDSAGGMIEFAAIGFEESDPALDMAAYRDKFLSQLYGKDAKFKFSDEQVDGRNLGVAAEIEGGPKPAKVWLQLKEGYGRMYFVLFETHPNAWNALAASFKQSTGPKFILRDPEG